MTRLHATVFPLIATATTARAETAIVFVLETALGGCENLLPDTNPTSRRLLLDGATKASSQLLNRASESQAVRYTALMPLRVHSFPQSQALAEGFQKVDGTRNIASIGTVPATSFIIGTGQ
jgi:hypothetical protein